MGGQIRSFRDLLVWQKGVDLVVECYSTTVNFPASEKYGLVSQVQRAAVSVPANIAEGHGRDHLGDYLRHLSIAKGSLTELETLVVIAQRLSFISSQTHDALVARISEVGRMLSGLSRSLAQVEGPST